MAHRHHCHRPWLVPFHHLSPSPHPQARDRKIAQDPAGAGSYGRKAKQVNIVAFCLGTVVTIICLVFLVQSYKMMLEGMKHH